MSLFQYWPLTWRSASLAHDASTSTTRLSISFTSTWYIFFIVSVVLWLVPLGGLLPSLRGPVLNFVFDILGYCFECVGDALDVIVSDAPALAFLGVIIIVAEYRPPIYPLAVHVFESIAVNRHAAALLDLVVIHCVLRFADAANCLLYFSFHDAWVLWEGSRPPD